MPEGIIYYQPTLKQTGCQSVFRNKPGGFSGGHRTVAGQRLRKTVYQWRKWVACEKGGNAFIKLL